MIEGYGLGQEWRDTVRAFEGSDWSTLYRFPATMNGCDMQRFFIRWRAVNQEAVVDSTFVSTGELIELADPVSGAAGWMAGYGCSQPAFRMRDSAGAANLTDIVVEVQQWDVSV